MNRPRLIKDTQDRNTDIHEVSVDFADSKIPEFTEQYGQNYIKFGDTNDYPDYLLLLYNKSSKHNAIINGKCTYILGNGVSATTPEGDIFLKRANESQSWEDLLKYLCLDIENFGGCYVQVIPKLGGGYNYYHISYNKIRSNKTNTRFYYREKWENNLKRAEVEYPVFYNGIKQTSIYFYKEYRCSKDTYPLPSWVSACNWIESDIEVSKHTLTNAKTGFSASKFINFYNGEPAEAKKRAIEKRLENAATGAEGKKLLIAFNTDPNKKPSVDDLGQSDLTKENFGQVDALITGNIFSGHSITHPLLFGIQQEGKLGNATELKVAFDIFKNTYVNHKQRNLESLVTYFSKVENVFAEYHIKDIEPVGIDLDPIQFKELLPKNWVLEKLGIDESKYNIIDQSTYNNETLVKLTGRQQQNLLRIVRLFSQGKLTKSQAAIQLQAYGFTNDQINQYLGIDDDPNTEFSEYDDEYIADVFSEYGEDRTGYAVLKSVNFIDEETDTFQAFAEYTDNENKVMELLKKQPDLTNDAIAEALQLDKQTVNSITDKLTKDKVIDVITKGGIIKRTINERITKTLPEIKVMYTYEKRLGVSGPELLPTSRPFCVKMVNLSKTRMFSRQAIQQISERLGYSVFKRAGGFWNNNGKIEYQCRHGWMKHIVIKK